MLRYGVLFTLALVVGMIGSLEIGRRVGRARRLRNPEGATNGVAVFQSAVFGLLSLLLAFTFNGAATRFEGRRALMISEGNAMGTAYLRLDLLTPERRNTIRAKMREYTDSRIASYSKMPDVEAALRESDHSKALQHEIWGEAVAATQLPGAPPQQVVLPPLNEMFDLASTQIATVGTHPPAIIFYMLGGLAMVGALLAGYDVGSAAKRNVLHATMFVLALVSTIYVIIDLEYPLLGLIRIDNSVHILVDARRDMN